MHGPHRKQPRFNQSDTLTGLGFVLLVGLSAVFYSAGHQAADQPSILRSDEPEVNMADRSNSPPPGTSSQQTQ